MIGGQIRTFGTLQTMKVFNSFPGPDSLRKNNYKAAAVLLACTDAVAGKTPLSSLYLFASLFSTTAQKGEGDNPQH